jgi:hypothetical protein
MLTDAVAESLSVTRRSTDVASGTLLRRSISQDNWLRHEHTREHWSSPLRDADVRRPNIGDSGLFWVDVVAAAMVGWMLDAGLDDDGGSDEKHRRQVRPNHSV